VKRILIFSAAYFPYVGGAEIAIKEITDRIDDLEFHMVTPLLRSDLLRQEKIGNVMVHRVGFRFGGKMNQFLYQGWGAMIGLRLNREYQFAALWAMMAHSSGVPAALFKLFSPGTPYILTLQEGDPFKYIERLMLPVWPLFVRAFTSADVVQVISTYLGEWARRRGFAGPLEVVPNGVDIELFAGPAIPHEGTVLITSSRLVYKNAIDDILRAVSLLPEVRLVVAGTGPDEAELKTLARRLGIAQRTSWIGHIDHARLPQHLHAADIFVRPSRSEGMGNSFVEAFAAGLPVIATQVGGLADFITPEVAWPVQPDSPEDIAHAVHDILSRPEHTAHVVEAAAHLVYEKYTWDSIAKMMRERIFDCVFSKKRVL
jgi:glycosyltransferase involved in cell wall biosynthesis